MNFTKILNQRNNSYKLKERINKLTKRRSEVGEKGKKKWNKNSKGKSKESIKILIVIIMTKKKKTINNGIIQRMDKEIFKKMATRIIKKMDKVRALTLGKAINTIIKTKNKSSRMSISPRKKGRKHQILVILN